MSQCSHRNAYQDLPASGDQGAVSEFLPALQRIAAKRLVHGNVVQGNYDTIRLTPRNLNLHEGNWLCPEVETGGEGGNKMTAFNAFQSGR
jgi:hypothetical protein